MAKCTGAYCPMQVGYDVENCDNAECLYRTKPMTNADRIRAMSDEELADFIMYDFCADSNGVLIHDKTLLFTTNNVMEWLRQPAEMPKEDC